MDGAFGYRSGGKMKKTPQFSFLTIQNGDINYILNVDAKPTKPISWIMKDV
jgi:hypothetical protein